jgi:hypothetical protein
MNKSLVLILVVLGLGLLACILPLQPTPVIQCTAPFCDAGRLLCPSGDCPGGCGTICATLTPGDAITVTPPGAGGTCSIVVRTPPPEAPTASVNGTPDPNHRIDPHVEICASATEARVGDIVTLRGQAVDLGLPEWTLHARENGLGDFVDAAQVSYEGELTLGEAGYTVLEAVSTAVDLNQVTLYLEAMAPGEVELTLSATGEIHYGSPGPATWGGGGSESVTLVVRE